MYGKWSQWKPVSDLPGKMYTEKLIETCDGLEITLMARDDSRGIKIFSPTPLFPIKVQRKRTGVKHLAF